MPVESEIKDNTNIILCSCCSIILVIILFWMLWPSQEIYHRANGNPTYIIKPEWFEKPRNKRENFIRKDGVIQKTEDGECCTGVNLWDSDTKSCSKTPQDACNDKGSRYIWHRYLNQCTEKSGRDIIMEGVPPPIDNVAGKVYYHPFDSTDLYTHNDYFSCNPNDYPRPPPNVQPNGANQIIEVFDNTVNGEMTIKSIRISFDDKQTWYVLRDTYDFPRLSFDGNAYTHATEVVSDIGVVESDNKEIYFRFKRGAEDVVYPFIFKPYERITNIQGLNSYKFSMDLRPDHYEFWYPFWEPYVFYDPDEPSEENLLEGPLPPSSQPTDPDFE